MVTITDKKYSEKDSELEANALENIKCRELSARLNALGV
jgi:hypothetical protein